MCTRLLSGCKAAGALAEAAALFIQFRPAQSRNAASQNTPLKFSTASNKALHTAETVSKTMNLKIPSAIEAFARARVAVGLHVTSF
eukprot:6176627-Pleurochrysis_carterae.AAC.1